MSELESLLQSRRSINAKISKIEDAERAAMNRSHIGKTFRYRNNYSCPEKPSDYWWLYAKCTKLDRWGNVVLETFEVDKNGDFSFHTRENIRLMEGYKPIPEAEYRKQLKRALAVLLNKVKP